MGNRMCSNVSETMPGKVRRFKKPVVSRQLCIHLSIALLFCFHQLPAGGLTARYYNNCCLSGTTVDKIDSGIKMDRGQGAPTEGIDKEYWSVRWTGQIELPRSGTYNFEFIHDDGIRLWVDGDLLIDKYHSRGGGGHSTASFSAPSSGKYPLRIEFMDIYDESECIFSWQTPGGSMEVVPEDVLIPTGGPKVCDNAIPRPYMGVVSESNPIALETLTPDAEIYYTTDGTDPTRQSTRYAGPFALKSDGIVKTLVVKDGWEDSHVYESREFVVYKGDGGDGLKAVFKSKFTGATVERIDPFIDIFDNNGDRWGPFQDPAIGQDSYEVTWSGFVVPEAGGEYAFYFKADDEITVNIQGIGSSTAEGGGEGQPEKTLGPAQLNAGERYAISARFFDTGHHGEAITDLQWSGPGIGKQVVPQRVLYSGFDHTVAVAPMKPSETKKWCTPIQSLDSRVIFTGFTSRQAVTGLPASMSLLPGNGFGIFDARGRMTRPLPTNGHVRNERLRERP